MKIQLVRITGTLINDKVKQWQAENPQDLINLKNARNYSDYYHYVVDGRCVGWISITKDNPSIIKSLVFVFIDPAYRGKGYMRSAVEFSKTMGVNCVTMSTFKNVSDLDVYKDFYTSTGFGNRYVLLKGYEVQCAFYASLEQPYYKIGGDMMLVLDTPELYVVNTEQVGSSDAQASV